MAQNDGHWTPRLAVHRAEGLWIRALIVDDDASVRDAFAAIKEAHSVALSHCKCDNFGVMGSIMKKMMWKHRPSSHPEHFDVDTCACVALVFLMESSLLLKTGSYLQGKPACFATVPVPLVSPEAVPLISGDGLTLCSRGVTVVL